MRFTKKHSCLTALLFAASTAPAGAATITVDTATDQYDNGNDCSLREAVAAMNIASDGRGCTASGTYGTNDVVEVPSGTTVFGGNDFMLTLTGTESYAVPDVSINDIDILVPLTIRGTGAEAPQETIIKPGNASYSGRAFQNHSADAVAFEKLELRGFQDGAYSGVGNLSSSVQLEQVLVRNNRGESAFIATEVQITDSAFVGNSADPFDGGALRTQQGSVVDSTFVRNVAEGAGGAISLVASGSRDFSLDNVTIVGNSAVGDGSANNDGGGGLHVGANITVDVRNTIIADNRAEGSGPDCWVEGTVNSADYNLIGDTGSCTGLVGGNSISGVSAGLAAAGLYDSTTTIRPPLATSAALDAGSCTDSSSGDISGKADQRAGTIRNVDGDGDGTSACDIGAVERQKTVFVVDAMGDTPDQGPGDGTCMDASGDCTLRAAIDEANANADLDEIALPEGTLTLSQTGTGENSNATGDLDVTEPLILRGQGANLSGIDADGIDRVIEARSSARTLAIASVSLSGGSVNDDGGTIMAERHTADRLELRLTGVHVTGSEALGASSGGGGIYLDRARLRAHNSTVSNNTADDVGGGITVFSPSNGYTPRGIASARLVNTTITGNSAGSLGGGLVARDGAAAVYSESSTVIGNTGGGAAYDLVAFSNSPVPVKVHGSVIGTCANANNGEIDSQGNNLAEEACGFSEGSDQQQVAAGLTALSETTGADVPLRVPNAGSNLVDAGSCLTADNRILPRAAFGGTRPQDADASGSGAGDGTYECDIGAAERQQVRVSQGSNTPGARTLPAGSNDVVVAQFELDNEAGESLDGVELTFNAQGSGDEMSDVTAVRLYLDNNGDGQLDAGDTQVDTDQTFSSDDGTVTFDLTAAPSPLISDGGQAQFIVVYDFASQLALFGQPAGKGMAWAALAPFGLLPLFGLASARRRVLAGLTMMMLAAALAGCGGDGGDDDDDFDPSRTETYTIAVDQVQVEGAAGGKLTIRTAEVPGNTLTIEE